MLVDLGGRQFHREAAIGEHNSRTEQYACGIGHCDGSAWFAKAGDHAAIGIDGHLGEDGRRREVRRLQRGDCRHVAGCVGLAEAEQFGVAQRRVESDGEVTAGIDHCRTDFVALPVADADLRAGLAAAGEGNPVAGNRKLSGGGRWGGIGCSDGAGVGLVAGGIGQYHLHLLAVGLWCAEGDLESTIGADHCAAQCAAIGSQHFDGAAGLAGTVEQAATAGKCQVARSIRCHTVGRSQADTVGLVARCVGLLCTELFAIDLCGAQANAEVTTGIDHGGAQVDTAFADHGHCGARLTSAGERQAVAAQHQVGQRLRGSGVRCLQGRRQRSTAIGAHGIDLQYFAVGLGAVEVDRETAVIAHWRSTQQHAVRAIHIDGAARGCIAGNHQAIG
ncbi:hypothetical protein D3C81_934330 [compost metagenome]